MSKKVEIIRIPLENLLGNPENPNRMGKSNFAKLKLHIKKSGNYEPIIVRKHPAKEGFFEIINGHHRCRALKEIGENSANCVQWDVDDDEARVLLATLNRLGGKDELKMKTEIIKNLSIKYSTKELAQLLPDTKQVIEKLKEITNPLRNFKADSKAFLQTLVFFLNEEQLKIVQKALAKASENISKTEKKAAALTKIAQEWLNFIEKEG